MGAAGETAGGVEGDLGVLVVRGLWLYNNLEIIANIHESD